MIARPGDDDGVADLAMELFRERGVAGEIYLERSEHTTITVHEGRIENLNERRAHGAGVRIFEDGRVAFFFTADLGREGIARAVDTARAVAPHTKQDSWNVLPAMASAVPPLVNTDRAIQDTPLAVKGEIARQVERAARSESPRIQKTREAFYQDLHATILLANTDGARLSHTASRAYAGIELAATDGTRSQTGTCVAWSLGPAGLDPGAIGREAARRALRKLGARQPATARTTVILDPEAAAGLFGALAGLFSADAVLKDRSLLAGRVGERIASSSVTLIDDGGIAGGYASAPVDGEGTPTSETVLIQEGRLLGFLHSAFTARKMNVRPTGNGVRGGYGGSPEPSPTNLYLRPTGVSRKALLGSVTTGVYVTEWMGLHTVNATTGDFSLGASGLEVKNGLLGDGIDRMAVSGNVLELLDAVEAVATDLAFLVQGGGSTVLLRNISVSGA